MDEDGFVWDRGAEARAHHAILELAEEYPQAAENLLTEAALLMEHVGKQEIHVDTGRLRASWGHFTPEHLTGERDESTAAEIAAQAERSARFSVGREVGAADVLVAEVGTTVDYAAAHNYRHRVFFAEKSLAAAIAALPELSRQYMRHMHRESGL